MSHSHPYNTRRSLPAKPTGFENDIRSNPYSQVRLWQTALVRGQGQSNQGQRQNNQGQGQGKVPSKSRSTKGQGGQGPKANESKANESGQDQGSNDQDLQEDKGTAGQDQDGKSSDTIHDIVPVVDVGDNVIPLAVDLSAKATAGQDSVLTAENVHSDHSALPPGGQGGYTAGHEMLGGPVGHMVARRYATSEMYAQSEGRYEEGYMDMAGEYNNYMWSSMQQINLTRKNKEAYITKEIKYLKSKINNLQKDSKRNAYREKKTSSSAPPSVAPVASISNLQQPAAPTATNLQQPVAPVSDMQQPAASTSAASTSAAFISSLQAIAAAVAPATAPMPNCWQVAQPQPTTSVAAYTPAQNHWQAPQPSPYAPVCAPAQSYWQAPHPGTSAAGIFQAIAPPTAPAPIPAQVPWQYVQPPLLNVPGQAAAAQMQQLMGENLFNNLFNNAFRNNQR